MTHRNSIDSLNCHNSEELMVPQHKLTLRKSCDACAHAKVRCIRRDTSCERCRRKSISCNTSYSQRRGRGRHKARPEQPDILDIDLFARTESMPSSPTDSSSSATATPRLPRVSTADGAASLMTSSSNLAHLSSDQVMMNDSASWDSWPATLPFPEHGDFLHPNQSYNTTSDVPMSEWNPNEALSMCATTDFNNILSDMGQTPMGSKASPAITSSKQRVSGSRKQSSTVVSPPETSEAVGDVITNLADAVDRLRETMEVLTSQKPSHSSTGPYSSIEESINRFRRGLLTDSQVKEIYHSNDKRTKR